MMFFGLSTGGFGVVFVLCGDNCFWFTFRLFGLIVLFMFRLFVLSVCFGFRWGALRLGSFVVMLFRFSWGSGALSLGFKYLCGVTFACWFWVTIAFCIKLWLLVGCFRFTVRCFGVCLFVFTFRVVVLLVLAWIWGLIVVWFLRVLRSSCLIYVAGAWCFGVGF